MREGNTYSPLDGTSGRIWRENLNLSCPTAQHPVSKAVVVGVEVPLKEEKKPVTQGSEQKSQISEQRNVEKEETVPPLDCAAAKVLSDQEVIAHTSTLWKYQPVPENEPEPYAEYKKDSASLGNAYHVIASRVRGKKHKHEGTNCDDWFETRNMENFVIAAVADGAGSRKFSRIGAKASCEGAMEFLETELGKLSRREFNFYSALGCPMGDSRFQHAVSGLVSVVQHAVMAAKEAVKEAYDARRMDKRYSGILHRDLELGDFASTFLLTVAVPMETSSETLVVSCQVGDGMVAALNTKAPFEQIVTLMGEPDSGAFSGETEFLTSSKIDGIGSLANRTKVARKPFDFILSMTDGVADDYDPNATQMLRLYLDLKANRIIDAPEWRKVMESRHLHEPMPDRIPKPQTYPSIDGKAVTRYVPIQYTKDMLDMNGWTLRELWESHQDDLARMASYIEPDQGKNAAFRLQDWLDNYVIRGSFDDRTLVILQRGGI